MKITFVTQNYLTEKLPHYGAFVVKLVNGLRDLGFEVDVIAPIPVNQYFKHFHWRKSVIENVSYPLYLSLGNRFPLLYRLTQFLFYLAVERVFNARPRPDLIIGKFLFFGGYTAIRLGKKNGLLAYVDLGESKSLLKQKELINMVFGSDLSHASGYFCVSQRLCSEICDLGVPDDKIYHFPNSVDRSVFFPNPNKELIRKQLGIPKNLGVVCFIGHFIPRKGNLRVLQAIQMLENISGVFIGGTFNAGTRSVFFSGHVDHKEIPRWLSASDVFVLPTLSEGHCNVINEAIACEIPIITSNIPDIFENIPSELAILVDPLDVTEIAQEIDILVNNQKKRESLQKKMRSYNEKNASYSRSEKIYSILISGLEN